jgi:hypothetical protein
MASINLPVGQIRTTSPNPLRHMNVVKRRKTPIAAFQIPSDGHAMKLEYWAARPPQAVRYGLPESKEYPHPSGGTYTRCRVDALTDEGFLGYVPLPCKYADAWTQLCYTVVYWLSQWQAWVKEMKSEPRVRGQPTSFARDSANNAGARFLQYLIIRRLVIDELLLHQMSQSGDDELALFDE